MGIPSYFKHIINSYIEIIKERLDFLNIHNFYLDSNSIINDCLNNINTQLDVFVSPGDSTIKEEYTFDHPNELFEATGNKNIYIDYLSIGASSFPGFQGLRSLTSNEFIARCRLDVAKFSPISKALSICSELSF